jgi:hypothetical protein
MSIHSQLKCAVADEALQSQSTAVAGPQEKTTADNAGTKEAVLPLQAERTAEDVSADSPVSYATPATGATDESLLPHVSVANGDRPMASGDGRPFVQRETEIAAKADEKVSAKKSAKAQESTPPKTVQKTVGTVVNPTSVEVKPVVGNSSEGAILVAGQPIAPQSEKNEISKATDVLNKAISAVTKPSTGASSRTVDDLIRKEVVPGAKTSITDGEITVTAVSDLVASQKTGTSPEKMATVATPGGNDGENKAQGAAVSGTALMHTVGIVPTSVVPGNTTLTETKPLVGDAGVSTTGLPSGSREQDGSVVVAQSMDGAPRMLTATPTSLEVGIQNGTHGWLKVRAEMADGGGVNASVSAASPAGQEMLHRELPALTAYLQEEKVAVNAVSVHTSPTAGADARSSPGTDGAGGQTPQRGNGGEDQHQNLRRATLNGSDETMTNRTVHGTDEDGLLPLAAYTSGGGWLSVRA